MKTTKLLLLISCLASGKLCAQHNDANWPFGFHEYPGNSAYGNGMVHFLPDTAITSSTPWNVNFESTVAALSDAEGNLLFASNGCVVLTAQGDTMEAFFSNELNSGAVSDLTCSDYGYPAPNSMIALPRPGRDSQYMLFYTPVKYTPEQKWQYSNLLFYSVIDMSANHGDGLLLPWNNLSFHSFSFSLEPFSAVRHGNGRDWWIIAPGRNTNYYFTFLISPYGIQEEYIQLGPDGNCPRTGSSAFSPDGRKFARTQNCRTVVFDFDRCTGALSNPVEFDRPQYVFGGGGVAFSPEGDRLFVTEQLAVLSADLTMSQPTLDTIVHAEEMIGTSLGLMQAAPNGRLYINSTHRSRYLASFKQINSTNVDFQAKSLFLNKYSARTLPHFPNYRLYDLSGSSCDSLGINGPVSTNAIPEKATTAQLFPNPFQELLTVNLPAASERSSIRLSDQLGRVVLRAELLPGNTILNTEKLRPGIYFWEISTKNHVRLSGKLIKTEN
ncbi:MAG: T9SS type A sorting domain-containing protein [Saprospiraceae bacterium]